MFSSSILALLSLVPLALSVPNPEPAWKNPAPLSVNNLDIFEPTGRPGDTSRYTVSFGVSDPSDGSSTTCQTNWAYADAYTGYPSEYLANCTDPSYAFKFVDYKRYFDFKLDVKHSVKRHGPKRTLHAQGLVVANGNVRCVHASSGFSRCTQQTDFPLVVYKVEKN